MAAESTLMGAIAILNVELPINRQTVALPPCGREIHGAKVIAGQYSRGHPWFCRLGCRASNG